MNILRRFAAKFSRADKLHARRTTAGIKPAPYKERSLRSRIMTTPLPKQLAVPIGYSNDSIVCAIVKVGDRVLKYQKLSHDKPRDGERNGNKSGIVPDHAPTSGTVEAIEIAAITHQPFLENRLCLRLSPDGLDEAILLNTEDDYRCLNSSQLLEKIADAGLTDMGEAGFPSAKKLTLALQKKIDLLIINAVECEPYISADEALIRERATEVMIGADILQLTCEAKRCIIAIEECKKCAIAALEEAAKSPLLENTAIELLLIPNKYPAGAEKQLIQCVTGLEVPAGHHPADIGILTQNAGTAFAAFQAVVEGKPCISRITTLTGNAVKTAKNFEALIGTPVEFLFDLCGIDRCIKVKCILGGSLTGHELLNDEAVVSKTSNCLIAGTIEEFPGRPQEQACIRCGFCANACPANLLPQQLYVFSKSENNEQLLQHGLFDCIECGACDYVCPSHIPLVKYYRERKNHIKARQSDLEKSQEWQQRFQFHQQRIKKDKDQTAVKKAVVTNPMPIDPLKSTVEENNSTAESFSKETASREIAAAVARVKARRSKATNNSTNSPTSSKKPPSGSVD